MLKYSSIFISLICLLLNGCWTSVFTGASLIYDRHNIYIKLNDYQLAGVINKQIYKDKVFKCKTCSVEAAVFNLDVLLVGSVPNRVMRDELIKRVDLAPGKRRVFNQVTVSTKKDDPVLDSWITGNIRSKILADSSIDPHVFKVVTSRRIVYIMGDVKMEQAEKVILFARETPQVQRVVNLLRYYKYVDKHSK